MDKLEEDDNRLELWLRYPNSFSRLLFVTLQLIIFLKK